MSRIQALNLVKMRPIGIIHTPFVLTPGSPVRSVFGWKIEGNIIIDAPYISALEDIEGFERIWLIYWMDRVSGFRPHVTPYLDRREHGLFATRSACRPNPIGMSVVRLISRKGCVLNVSDVDILDGTPILDIKPYVPEFDSHPKSKAGWFDASNANCTVAGGRFHKRIVGKKPAGPRKMLGESK